MTKLLHYIYLLNLVEIYDFQVLFHLFEEKTVLTKSPKFLTDYLIKHNVLAKLRFNAV